MPDPHVGGDRPASRSSRPPAPSKGKRGRPLNEIKGYGPAAQFARKLRDQLTAAGRPRRVDLAAEARSNPTTMSKVDGGRDLPTWDKVAFYLKGCAVDAAAVAAWKVEHAEFAARAARFRPDLSTATDRAAVHAAARELLDGEGVDRDRLLRHRADAARNGVAIGLPMPEPIPEPAELLEDPPGDQALLWTIYLGGGTAADVQHWAQHLTLLGPAPVPAPDPDPVPEPVGASWSQRWWQRRWPVVVGAGAVGLVLVVAVAAVAADRGGPHTGRPAATSGPSLTSPPAIGEPAGTTGDEAVRTLNALADRVERVPGTPAKGRYAHIHRSLRSVDTTGPTGAAPQAELTDEWLTWSPDRDGRRVTQVTRDGVTTTGKPEVFEAGPPRGAPREPGTDLSVMEQDLATRRPARMGPPRMLLGVADLYEIYPMTAAQRAAVLRLLARVEGITVRDQARDRAGRPGIAVSADHADGKRETLIFDPLDGRLLAHETSVPVPDGRAVTEDVVFLEATYDDQPG